MWGSLRQWPHQFPRRHSQNTNILDVKLEAESRQHTCVLGGKADGVVETEPEVANNGAERPVLAEQQVRGVEGHREEADEEVAGGEREDEVIVGRADRALDHERAEHHQVARDGREAEHHAEQRGRDRRPHRVVEREWAQRRARGVRRGGRDAGGAVRERVVAELLLSSCSPSSTSWNCESLSDDRLGRSISMCCRIIDSLHRR